MSSLFTHIFIPVLILILFSKKLGIDPKEALALSLFAALPDADHVFLLNRATLHNVFLILVPLLLFVLVKRRRNVSGIICFYLASHLILDLFNGGLYLLYPVYNKVFFANAELLFNRGSFMSVLDLGISDKIVARSKIINMTKWGTVVSSEDVGIAILFVAVAVAFLWQTRKRI